MLGIARVLFVCLLAGGCALLGPQERAGTPVPDPAPGAGPAPADSLRPESRESGNVPAEGPPTESAIPGAADPVPREDGPAPSLPATTVASLGEVARPGLWMRTPLVTAPMRGRVTDDTTGASVVLDLIPLDAPPGAGSRMSLAAYQALDLPLTALPELRVEPAG